MKIARDSNIEMSKQFDCLKHPRIYFMLKRDNFKCFKIGLDYRIFSLMRSMVVMKTEEAHCYG